MPFKIPGPKAAALGQYKSRCEEWVEAMLASDKAKAAEIMKAIEAEPESRERTEALTYLRKKLKTGLKVQGRPARTSGEPVKKTPIDTMRLAVNLLTISRRPFAEALMEAVQKEKVSEAVLLETKSVVEQALVALRRQSEFRDLYKIPETIR